MHQLPMPRIISGASSLARFPYKTHQTKSVTEFVPPRHSPSQFPISSGNSWKPMQIKVISASLRHREKIHVASQTLRGEKRAADECSRGGGSTNDFPEKFCT